MATGKFSSPICRLKYGGSITSDEYAVGITLLEVDGSAFDLTGLTPEFFYKGPTGWVEVTGVIISGAATEGKIELPKDFDASINSGEYKCRVRVVTGTGDKVTKSEGYLLIQE